MKIEIKKIVDELLNNRYVTESNIMSRINSSYYNEREAEEVLNNIRRKAYKTYMNTENTYYCEIDDFLNRYYIETHEIETAIKIINMFM